MLFQAEKPRNPAVERGFCVMYDLLIKRLIEKYKIYSQIDDYLDWKSRFANTYRRKESLRTFARHVKRRNLADVTIEDLETFKRHLYAFCYTDTELTGHLREIRCLLRFHHKRGLRCLKPEVVGDKDIIRNVW